MHQHENGWGWRFFERMNMAGRGHGRGHGFGGFPPGPPPPGGFGRSGGFPWPLFARGPRARRGDVRAAILALLAEQPRNGYQIIQELGERSQGVWRPSPGSVYPTLQQLEDEGLVKAEASGGGRVYQLTDAGREYVASHKDETSAPWESVGNASGGEDAIELIGMVRQIGSALMQVACAGTATQMTEARRILTETRKSLYRILAEDPPADDS